MRMIQGNRCRRKRLKLAPNEANRPFFHTSAAGTVFLATPFSAFSTAFQRMKRAPVPTFDSSKQLLFAHESFCDAFVAIDYQFRFLFLNRIAERYYRRCNNELVGLSIESMFPELWRFGPFIDARRNVERRVRFEMSYNSPVLKDWVQLRGNPFENYYTFTYRIIDHKEALTHELRSEIKKSTLRK